MRINEITRMDFLADDFFERIRNISIAELKMLIYLLEDQFHGQSLLHVIPNGRIMVIGDLHGDIATALLIIKHFVTTSENTYIVFLGDYIDRGVHQVDTIILLLLARLHFPDRVVLLRGNHEIGPINQIHGFMDCLKQQYGGQDGKILWFTFNRLFKHFPLAALIHSKIFLVHGGIPEGMQSIYEINDLPKEFNPMNQITIELLWNDPKESKRVSMFQKGSRGGTTKVFGVEAFNRFIERNSITTIIRGHEELNNGYKHYFDEKLISIFSGRKRLNHPFERQVKPKFLLIEPGGKLNIVDIESS